MDQRNVNTDGTADRAGLERQVNRLVAERGALFDKAGTNFGLSNTEQERLAAVERELDECFLARRRQRADRDATRFGLEKPLIRRVPRTPPS